MAIDQSLRRTDIDCLITDADFDDSALDRLDKSSIEVMLPSGYL